MTERLRELLHQAGPEPEPLQVNEIAHRVRRRRRARAGMAAAVSAAVVAAIVVPLAVSAHSGPRAELVVANPSPTPSGHTDTGFTPPPSITVSGTVIPYAGPVPWSDAVIASPGATWMMISADIGQKLCGYNEERVEVRQEADAVEVLVAGYAKPAPVGVACTADRRGPAPLAIRLQAPLGARHLVDAYDHVRHEVLVASTVATVSGVPSAYYAQPISWEDTTRVVHRSWTTTGSQKLLLPPSTITLTKAPAGTIEADGMPDGALVASGVPVADALARVWSYASSYNGHEGLEITIRWTGADGSAYQLVTSTWSGSTISVPQAEALARSVHVG